MRFTRASVGLGVSSLFALGCGSDKVVGPASQITLSAAQATVLMNKIGQFAPLHNQIAWLADSANLVIKSGSQVDLILVSTNLAPGPFYAVGLQRAVQLTGSSFSTFDLIAFNDPSNPTDFIVIDGYNSGSGAPPTSTSAASRSSPASALRLVPYTVNPASTSARAAASPIPDDAPVTSATRPVSKRHDLSFADFTLRV